MGHIPEVDGMASSNRTATGCGGSGCADSPQHRRLQSGLAVGGLCLLLLVVAAVAFTCYMKKQSKKHNIKPAPAKRKKKKERRKKRKDKNTERPAANKTVFTISNDHCESDVPLGSTRERDDMVSLVFPEQRTPCQPRVMTPGTSHFIKGIS